MSYKYSTNSLIMKYIILIITMLLPITMLAQNTIVNTSMPQAIKDYAANIKDNGKSLEKEQFSLGYGTIKGKIYDYSPKRYRGNFYATIDNPFSFDDTDVRISIADDGSFEVKLPMVVKHQWAAIWCWGVINGERVLISQGKTSEIYYDTTRKQNWRAEPMPFFKGENADINYAISLIDEEDLALVLDEDEDNEYAAKCSPNELKQYIFTKMNNGIAKYTAMNFTTRAKEMIRIVFKGAAFYQLNNSDEIFKRAYRRAHHLGLTAPIPDYTEPIFDDSYWDYPKLLGMNDINMYYDWKMGRRYSTWLSHFYTNFPTWNVYIGWLTQQYQILQRNGNFSKEEIELVPIILEKRKNLNIDYTDEEKAFIERYADVIRQRSIERWNNIKPRKDSLLADWFGQTDNYVSDLIKLRNYCFEVNPYKTLSSSSEPLIMPDSLMQEIKKMRFPIYYKYFKRVKDDVQAQKDIFEKRGGYHVHEINVNNNDSVFDALVSLFKGKVILIDFEHYWTLYSKEFADLIDDHNLLKDAFQGKDVAFVYITSPMVSSKDWEEKSIRLSGNHLHVNEFVHNALASKFCPNSKFKPQIVLVGKDGNIIDIQDSFKGAEYYKTKIMEALKGKRGAH